MGYDAAKDLWFSTSQDVIPCIYIVFLLEDLFFWYVQQQFLNNGDDEATLNSKPGGGALRRRPLHTGRPAIA